MASRVAAVAVALAVVQAAPAARAASSVVGSAEVTVSAGRGKLSARVVYAASADPPALRLEVIRGGAVNAYVWCDGETLQVLVPGGDPVLHETVPTREGFERALDLPFCGDELLFTLLAGRAPVPACHGDGGTRQVLRRGDTVVGLSRLRHEAGGVDRLKFSRFDRTALGPWPSRAVLEVPGAVTVVRFGLVRRRDGTPQPLQPDALEAARPVDAPELRRILGLDGAAAR